MIKVFANNEAFLIEYGTFLFNDEIQYSLLLGLSQIGNPNFLFVESKIEEEFLVGLLAGKNLIIASNTLRSNVYDELIDFMDTISYPGIIGTKRICEKYNERYQYKYGVSLYLKMNQRIYFCDQVMGYRNHVGEVRLAKMEDVGLLKYWALDFSRDIEENPTVEDAEKSVITKIEKGVLYVLVVNGKVSSMAARARAMHLTETVSFVYTPQEERRKGYASQVVETITNEILQDGRIATLYTDLDNPISNSIYKKIGYQEYCDSVMMNKEI